MMEHIIVTTLFWTALTIYHEARGESYEGQKNVAKVILNRADKNDWRVEDIVKARKQFSCFNDGVPPINHPVTFLVSMKAAHDAFYEWLAGSRLGGATHYYAPKGMKGGLPPYWIKGMKFVVQEGNHSFYREV